ncbi:MAG: site-specific integrase [Burkholderiaceae bacterium]|jgi:integrase|nr:site-specific integrase [Burkholderiaceae bacterium]MEB2351271.1 site-specific integrase [Burkholderiaceae bacterium]
MLDDWLVSFGFKIDPDSEQYRKLAYEFAKASAAALDAKLRRDAGAVVDSPSFPEVPASLRAAAGQQEDPTLRSVLDRWKKERTPASRTVDEYLRFLDLFDDVNGPSIPVARITKAHVVAFKDRLVDEGLQAATIQKRLAAIKTLLNFAETNDLVPSNVARTVNIVGSRVKKKARLPFRDEDLKRLFASPVFVSGDRPKGGGGEAAYWLPVLGLYTGARQEELAQLAVADVREEDGIRCLVITDEGDGKVKTASSRRKVPLHRDVLDLGVFPVAVRLQCQPAACGLFRGRCVLGYQRAAVDGPDVNRPETCIS